jgi:arginine utilization regulatory protein
MSLIKDALEKTSGKPSASARLLGISPQLLNYKMKKYQISHKKYKP